MAHEEDNIDTSMVAVVGVISAGLSFALIFLLMVLYHSFDNAQEKTEMLKPHEQAERLLASQEAILNDSAWVDENKGQVRIPVSAAMPMVVATLQETPDDAGVNPPEFAESDATIADPEALLEGDDTNGAPAESSTATPATESKDAVKSGEQSSEKPATEDGSPKEESSETTK